MGILIPLRLSTARIVVRCVFGTQGSNPVDFGISRGPTVCTGAARYNRRTLISQGFLDLQFTRFFAQFFALSEPSFLSSATGRRRRLAQTMGEPRIPRHLYLSGPLWMLSDICDARAFRKKKIGLRMHHISPLLLSSHHLHVPHMGNMWGFLPHQHTCLLVAL